MAEWNPQANDIFVRAVEIDAPVDRRLFLEQQCAGDAGLRAQVDSLLAAGGKVGSFLEKPAVPASPAGDATMVYGPLTEGPGTVIGPYKLLQHIGEGGFGAVYMAEQEHPVRRKVALKIIKPGMDTREVIARFESERQALAMMEHPNISRVFDAGATASGRPYFVMELVRGVPITEFCDKNRLPAAQRLKLFVTVCHAIQHAHHKGIIHRDIKPSNVMVTLHDGVPVVKVIDFGVAKATAQKLTERTLFTAYGQMIGTPAYMSPEQAEMSGLDIDMRSDIFSLGVLLYELLTGTTPLDSAQLRKAGYAEMQRLIREEEAPRPSTRFSSLGGEATAVLATNRGTDVRRLSQLLRSDLDWIVMKSLEKDRNRRYGSPDNFAADVERYLTEQPVEARPPSTWYRFRKTARRNKAALTTAAMVATVLVLGTAVSVWQAMRATKAEVTARVAEAKAVESADEAIHSAETARDALALAVTERDAAQAAKTELRRSIYTTSMSLISTVWNPESTDRAIELLDQQRPKSGEEDTRGFEWHYWDRLCHSERRELVLDQYRFLNTFSGDGRFGAITRKVNPYSNPQGGGGVIEILDLASGKVVSTLPDPNSVEIGYRLNNDGSRLATISRIDTGGTSQVTVRNVADGKEIFRQTIGGKISISDVIASGPPRHHMAISPDGRRLATFERGELPGAFLGSQPSQYVVKIWDLDDSAREPTELPPVDAGWGGNPKFLFSPDGKHLAVVTQARQGVIRSVTPDSTVQVLNLVTGEILIPFVVQSAAFELAFSPDSTRLIGAASSPLRTMLWEIEADGQINQLRSTPIDTTGSRMRNALSGFATSSNGRLLAVSAGRTWLIDTETGNKRGEIKSEGRSSGAFTNDDTGFLVLRKRDTISTTALVLHEWDIVADDAPPEAMSSENTSLEERIFTSRDGERQAIYRPNTGELSVRNRTGKELHMLQVGKPRKLGKEPIVPNVYVEDNLIYPRIEFSPNGCFFLVTNASSGAPKIYETDSGEKRWSGSDSTGFGFLFPHDPKRVELSPDNRFLALQKDDGFQILTFDDFKERGIIYSTSAKYNMLRFSPEGSKLVTVGRISTSKGKQKGQLVLWDLETGREISSAEIFPSRVVFSPNSRFYATSGSALKTTIWNADSGTEVSTFSGDSGNLERVFNPMGTALLVWQGSGLGGLAAVWDTTQGTLQFRLEGLSGTVGSVVYSPDGKRIATASTMDGSTEVKLWDASNGHELLSLPVAASGSVNVTDPLIQPGRLSFSPDGHRLTFVDGHGNESTWDATPRPEMP